MGGRTHHQRISPDDPSNEARGVMGSDRIRDPGGGPIAFGGAFRAGSTQQPLLPAVDDGVSLDSRGDPPQHAVGAEFCSRDLPCLRQPVGCSNDPLDDARRPSRSRKNSPSNKAPSRLDHRLGSARDNAALARSYLANRRRRSEMFGDGLFADPAWDMLLDLYANEQEQQQICITSACLAGGVPSTTALGWLLKLEKQGFVLRSRDPCDGRRAFLHLSPATSAMIESWLTTTFAGMPR